jgi:hypothetical protein
LANQKPVSQLVLGGASPAVSVKSKECLFFMSGAFFFCLYLRQFSTYRALVFFTLCVIEQAIKICHGFNDGSCNFHGNGIDPQLTIMAK